MNEASDSAAKMNEASMYRNRLEKFKDEVMAASDALIQIRFSNMRKFKRELMLAQKTLRELKLLMEFRLESETLKCANNTSFFSKTKMYKRDSERMLVHMSQIEQIFQEMRWGD